MENQNNERVKWLDMVRTFAIVCVVMCHAVENGIYNMNAEYMQSAGTLSKIFAITMFSVGRLGVPLFLIISGWLLLDRDYTDTKCKQFWKQKCCGLLLVMELWIIVYNLFLNLFNGYEISITNLIREMLLLQYNPMSHVWYLPMILGMYITIPFAANALHALTMKTVITPWIIMIICFLGIPVANDCLAMIGIRLGNSVMSTGFSGGYYGCYLISGFLLKKGILNRIKTRVLSVFAFVGLGILILIQICSYYLNYNYSLWYNNVFLFLCGVIFFEIMSRTKKVSCEKLFLIIARYSFAIYLIHNPINMLLARYTTFITVRPLRVIVVWGATVSLSLFATVIIGRIPKLGKKILYIR